MEARRDDLRAAAYQQSLEARRKGDEAFAKALKLPVGVERESAYYSAASWYRIALTIVDMGEQASESLDVFKEALAVTA